MEIDQADFMNGIAPIVGGMAAGMLGAIPSGWMIAALLYAVHPTDAAVYVISRRTVVLAGMAANYIPARRVARINPMTALRVE